jgi:hypothetical protein
MTMQSALVLTRRVLYDRNPQGVLQQEAVMPDGGSRRGGTREGDLSPEVASALKADAQLQACVAAARERLRARGVGGGRKGRAVSARVDEALLAAAGARLGVTSQTEVLNAGLAMLAGADTFGVWLMSQAGTLDPSLDVDV